MQRKHKVIKVLNRTPYSFTLITRLGSVGFSFKNDDTTLHSLRRLKRIAPHIIKEYPTEIDPEVFLGRFIYGTFREVERNNQIFSLLYPL